MSPRNVLCVVTVGVAVYGCCGVAGAQVVVDNLAEPTRAATVLGTADPDRLWAAQSFSSPSRFTLSSIEVLAGNAMGKPDAVAELRRDDPAGALVASFGAPVLSDAGLVVTLLVPLDVSVLEPDVLYWLVMGSATIGSFEWAYAVGNMSEGPGAFGAYGYSEDSGATWSSFGAKNPYQMRVNVTPACTADFNADGVVNSQDFFDFLIAFFSGAPAADFNADGTINSQDFFDFLGVFFAGC